MASSEPSLARHGRTNQFSLEFPSRQTGELGFAEAGAEAATFHPEGESIFQPGIRFFQSCVPLVFKRGSVFFCLFFPSRRSKKKGLLSVDERKDLGEKREDKEEEDKEDEWKRGLKRNRSSSSNGP